MADAPVTGHERTVLLLWVAAVVIGILFWVAVGLLVAGVAD
jgi:hypothetical protein